MQRRTFLTGTSIAATTLLAGCTGGGGGASSADATGDNNNNNNNNSTAASSESESSSSSSSSSGGSNGSGNGSESESESSSGGGLEITEHELTTDDFSSYIEGVVVNNTGSEQSYVELEAEVYNSDGQKIGTPFTNTQNLADGGEWAFELMLTSDSEEIDEYELSVTDSAA